MTIHMNKILTFDEHNIFLIVDTKDGNKKVSILLHGIFTDKREKGRFDRLSSKLVEEGSDVIRFDFRGHGESNLSSTNFNVSGALTDLIYIINNLEENKYDEINLVGSSFGGSIALLYFNTNQHKKIDRLILLNPVVNYSSTFINPELKWGKEIFSEENVKLIYKNGKGLVMNNFEASLDFYNQLQLINPEQCIENIDIPTLVFHGTIDDKVPCKLTINAYKNVPNAKLEIIEGAGHAFKEEKYETYVHEKIVRWINDRQ